MSLILSGTNGVSDIDGDASTPAIRGTDANTGIFFPAADTIAFAEGGAEAMRIDSDGDVGIGTTTPGNKLTVVSTGNTAAQITGKSTAAAFSSATFWDGLGGGLQITNSETTTNAPTSIRFTQTGATDTAAGIAAVFNSTSASNLVFCTNSGGLSVPERARIDSSGNLLIGKSVTTESTAGHAILSTGQQFSTMSGGAPLVINRLTSDGTLVAFKQDTNEEGSISVAGTTVSYNGGHLSRWAQMPGTKDDTLVKGTVMSNLDEMNVYTDAEGNPVDNEQLNKVKVSDVEGDVNVAGVFVNWDYDEAHQVDEINMAMTGDMIIRIAQGVVVQKGDLLMSAGDGTAKPQGDDIVRSKTVAKVTSNHVTCTYADGSYCVPCVLMAC